MQHAGRLVSPLSRTFRSTLLRPVIPHAGPSTLPRRLISTDPTLHATPAPFSATTRESVEIELLRSDEVNWQEQMDDVLKYNKPTFHRKPQPGEPILLPLSSLASATPAAPVESNLAITLAPEYFNAPVRRDILHQCVVWFLACKRAGTKKTKGRGEVNFSGHKLRPQKGTGRARLGDRGSPMLRKGGVAHPHKPRDWSYNLPRKVRALGLRMALSSKLHLGTLRVVNNLNEGQWTKTKQAAKAMTTGWRWIPRPGYEAPESDFMEKPEQEVVAEDAKPAVVAEKAEQTEVVAESAGQETTLAEGEYESGKWVWNDGFGSSDKLSVLFLHGPDKSARDILDFALPIRNIPNVELMSTDEVEVYHLLKYRWLIMEPGAIDAIMRQKGQVPAEEHEFAGVQEVPVETTLSSESQIEGKKTSAMNARLPKYFVLNKWRKIRGRKSLRSVLGLKLANEQQLQAKRAWKRLRWSGIRASPELVAVELNKRKSEAAW